MHQINDSIYFSPTKHKTKLKSELKLTHLNDEDLISTILIIIFREFNHTEQINLPTDASLNNGQSTNDYLQQES